MVILHDEEYYKSRIPQPDLGPLRNFLRFIWDNNRKAFLDRTAKEWGNHNNIINNSNKHSSFILCYNLVFLFT